MATRPRRRQFANQDIADKVEARAPFYEPSDTAKEANLCADWKLQIELAEQRNEKWAKRSKRIIKRYREDRPDGDTAMPRRMNILWSNVQTLQPCVYGRQPVPIAERRFLDRDDTGRVASMILERVLRYEMAFCGFHDSVTQSVLDYLLVGRGVAWLRYKPIIGPATSLTDRGDDELTDRLGMPDDEPAPDAERDAHNDSNEQTNETPEEELLSAELEVDYVHWDDFLHSKARFWKENTWVARRLYPSRKDLIDDFGEEIGKAVPLEMSPEVNRDERSSQRAENSPDSMKKAIAYEIWDKPTRKVYTVAKGFDEFLEEPRDDPLNLELFFPCPKPLFATMTNDTLEPVADYIEYQDQALEIDELTNRIQLLIKALKVAGVYDASQKQLARLLDEGHENKLIPVSSWAAFAEKGGLKSAISFLPIQEIATVLQALFDARDKIKQDLFEITGLSDIIRGQADPRETAEAVQTKGRWGSLRLQARQENVARFCRDIIAMMGEIASEHFPDETLINVSGAMYDEGIGGPEPTAPKPPDSVSPPMGIPPGGAVPGTGQPQPLNQLAARPGLSGMAAQMAGPGLQSHAMMPSPQGIGPAGGPLASGPASLGPAPGAAPPNPMAAFLQATVKYQHDMLAYQAKKQDLITKALALLRQDKLRGFRIDIETDSTISTDADEEKRGRTEFLEAMTGFLEKAFTISQAVPQAVPMLGKMILFGVRGFRTGRDLESTIEEFIDEMEKEAVKRENSPPPPNPELQAKQLEMQADQARSQAEVQKAQISAQSSAQDNQRDIAAKNLDAHIAQQQAAADMAKLRQDAQLQREEFAAKMAEMQMQMRVTIQQHAQETQRMHLEHRQHIEKILMAPKPEGKAA